jgi:hypothetical protein
LLEFFQGIHLDGEMVRARAGCTACAPATWYVESAKALSRPARTPEGRPVHCNGTVADRG